MVNINVPYNPVPQGPSLVPTPFRTAEAATPETFGAGIGRAEEQLGQQIERSASTVESNVLQAQRYKAEAEVNTGITSYIQQSGEKTNTFRQLPGSQAQDQLKAHVQDLQDARENIRNSLSSPRAQQMFDQGTMHRFALDVVNSSQYAAGQMKAYTKQSISDNSDAIIQETAKNVRDGVPGAIERGTQKLQENEAKLASPEMDNLPPETLKKNVRTQLTKMVSAITSPLSTINPEKAQAIFNEAKKKGYVDEIQVEGMQKTLDAHAIEFHSTMDATEIASNRIQSDPVSFTNNPQGMLIQMHQDAEKKADEQAAALGWSPIRRQEYLDQLLSKIGNKANVAKKEQDNQTNEYKTTLLGIAGQKLPNGRQPTNIQEMNSVNPNAWQYYDEAVRRDPHFAEKMRNQWDTNNNRDNIISPEQKQRVLDWWAGMQPSQKMQTDPGALFKQGVIDNEIRDKMYDEKNKIKSLANNVFAADSFMRRYKDILFNNGIYESKGDKDANDKYTAFRGALEFKLQETQQQTGRPVKGADEEKKIINDLLKEGTSKESTFFGFGPPAQKPAYEIMNEQRPDWVTKDAPNAQWNSRTKTWQTFVNGKLYDIEQPEVKK